MYQEGHIDKPTKILVNLNYFLCAFTIVINSKRGGALKAGVLIVMYIAT